MAAAARLPGEDLARRHAHRLPDEQLVGRGAPQLPRRPEPADLDRRSQDATTSSRRRGPTRRTWTRCGSATRSTSSPIATAWPTSGRTRRRRRSSTQVTKFTDFDVKTLDAGAGAVVFEQAGYIHELDPKSGQGARREHHGRGRLPVDDAALGGRDQPHDEHRALAHRQARGRRGARRDLHDPRREGRRPQPDATRADRPSATRRGRPTASTSRTSATSRASTSWSSRSRTASSRRARLRCRSRRTTTRRRGRPTRRSCSTPTRT